jgi:hypothetical protein
LKGGKREREREGRGRERAKKRDGGKDAVLL